MKQIFILLFSSFCLSVYSQVSKDDTLQLSGRKKIPLYEIKECVVPLLINVVDNCRSDSLLNKHPYGYLFYSKKKSSNFSIIIKPIETLWFFNPNFYGVFDLQGIKFYCLGDVPDLLNKTVSDYIEIEYVEKKTAQQDTIAIALAMNRFSDLNTKQVIKNITINKQLYLFYIQPCSNLTKKEIRKIRNRVYCDD